MINLERAQGETRVMRADFKAGGRGSFFVDSASENSVQRHRAKGNDANGDFQTSQRHINNYTGKNSATGTTTRTRGASCRQPTGACALPSAAPPSAHPQSPSACPSRSEASRQTQARSPLNQPSSCSPQTPRQPPMAPSALVSQGGQERPARPCLLPPSLQSACRDEEMGIVKARDWWMGRCAHKACT